MVLFWDYVKKHKKLIIVALVFATVNQIFSLLDPQIIRLLVDNYATKVNELDKEVFLRGVGLLLLGFIGVALVSRIAKNFQDYYTSVITQKVGANMYADSVDHTFSLPFKKFEDQRSGELLQKLQKAKTDSQTVIADLIRVVFLSAIGFILVLGYAFYVHWGIGVSFIIIVPLISSFIYSISKKIKKAQKAIVREVASLAGATTETIRNVELVKSLGLELQEIRRLNNVNDLILRLELKKVKLIRKLSFVQGTIINAMRGALLFLMLWLLFNLQMTLGEFLSLFFYSFFLFGPLGEIANVITEYQEAKASNEELGKILRIKSQKKPSDPVTIDKLDKLSFRGVSFSYRKKRKPSVQNINLEISGGDTVAFVGMSGSGKTTLVKLLLGLYHPTKGSLLLNGIDSENIDYDAFRKKIGLVSQSTQLFAGTVRDNLLFVNPQATGKECLNVLELASAMTIIERGGKGLNTKIGEGGIKISGGEKQRLAIARALLRDPELLIFDEATSNLDSLTEKQIAKTIQDVAKARPNLITILVAHRLSTVDHSDMIYVLENSKIIEKGKHRDLLKKKGLYAALWREQVGK